MGPLLFVIYYNDLPFQLKCLIHAYADDSTMSSSAAELQSISDILTENCGRVSKWMRQNRLKVNPEKTHLLTVGTSPRVDQLTSSIEVKMDGIQLKENPEKSEQLLA